MLNASILVFVRVFGLMFLLVIVLRFVLVPSVRVGIRMAAFPRQGGCNGMACTHRIDAKAVLSNHVPNVHSHNRLELVILKGGLESIHVLRDLAAEPGRRILQLGAYAPSICRRGEAWEG